MFGSVRPLSAGSCSTSTPSHTHSKSTSATARTYRAPIASHYARFPPQTFHGCCLALGSQQPGPSQAEPPETPTGPSWQQRLGTLCAAAALSFSLLAAAPWPVAAGPSTGPAPQPPAAEIVSSSGRDSSLQHSVSLPGADTDSSSGEGSDSAIPELDLASEVEDRMLEAARQLESRMESTLAVFTDGLHSSPEATARATTSARQLIQEVWEVVDQFYLDARSSGFDRDVWRQLRDQQLTQTYKDTPSAYRAVREMLAKGISDPYCRLISAADLAAMKKYDVTGVGLNLGTPSEYLRKTGNALPRGRDPERAGVYVVGVSKGSPADRAGLSQGDELIEVDGVPVSNGSPFQAASLIQGTSTSSSAATSTSTSSTASELVRIKVRSTGGGIQQVELARSRGSTTSPVQTSIARASPAQGGGLVGTIKLASFTARAQAEISKALQDLQAAGADRLVLDLRDNRGGLVTEGLEVARLFLEGDAPIVITETRDGPSDLPLAAGPALTRSPLLVLVNEHTASASEIVAGALQDNCRAVLAGSLTYGKGLIQSVYELNDGSGLVVTVGKYLTPNGTDIDRYGIKPNFASAPTPGQYESAINACQLKQRPLGRPLAVAAGSNSS